MTERKPAREDGDGLLKLATEIVAAYVSNNTLPSGELADVIKSVHATLGSLAGNSNHSTNGSANGVAQPNDAPLHPAVAIEASVTPDYIVCLEDGERFKMLRRHLRVRYNLSPDEYRAKWRLPDDYPMVAPNYAARRSEVAKRFGLGRNDAARAQRER